MDYKSLSNIMKSDGYLLIRDYFDNQEVEIIQNSAHILKELPEIKGGYMKYYENTSSNETDKRILSRIENFTYDNQMVELKEKIIDKVSKTLQEIMSENMNLFKDKINWKLPGGGKFKPHQDFEAWSDFPPKNFVSCAIFVDDCTKENGCLEMVQGENNKGILKNNNGCINEEVVNGMKWNPILSTKRDLVIFDAFVPHRSDKNNSNNSRRIIYLTYNKEAEGNHYNDYFIKKRAELPPDFERNDKTKINLNSKYNLANPIS